MARTYLPTLKFILENVCKYIAKHRDTIIDKVGESNAPKVDAVVTACNILMPILDALIPNGS